MRKSPPGSEAGLSLIEILISMALFSIGGLAVAGSLNYSLRLNAVNRETAVATQEARRVLEEIRSLPLEDVLKTYNDDPADDLDGYDTAAGNLFDLTSLAAPVGEEGGAKVEVVLPLSAGELLENLTNTTLGTIGDLDGDSKIDGKDHIEDFKVLPMAIRVRWKGAGGDRELTLHTILRR
jgi:prepilin-type N-terminal cleavage/methylation domain-containing protein